MCSGMTRASGLRPPCSPLVSPLPPAGPDHRSARVLGVVLCGCPRGLRGLSRCILGSPSDAAVPGATFLGSDRLRAGGGPDGRDHRRRRALGTMDARLGTGGSGHLSWLLLGHGVGPRSDTIAPRGRASATPAVAAHRRARRPPVGPAHVLRERPDNGGRGWRGFVGSIAVHFLWPRRHCVCRIHAGAQTSLGSSLEDDSGRHGRAHG